MLEKVQSHSKASVRVGNAPQINTLELGVVGRCLDLPYLDSRPKDDRLQVAVDKNWQHVQGSAAAIGASVALVVCATHVVKYKQTNYVISKSTHLSVDVVGYNMMDNTKPKDQEPKSDVKWKLTHLNKESSPCCEETKKVSECTHLSHTAQQKGK